jgi:hypothetical protein
MTTTTTTTTTTKRLSLLVSALLFAACGDGVTPEITALNFKGQAPDAPLVVVTEVEFSDPDGDLADGFIETFVNNKPSGLGQLSLVPYFLFAEEPLNAGFGAFDFQLELNLGEDTEDVAVFDLGFRLTDAAGHVSPTKSIRLRLER